MSIPTDLQAAEDSRAKLDFDTRKVRPRGFIRPATSAERELLAWLGYDLPDGELTTEVTWASSGVRTRRWPVLEQETTP